MSLKHRLTEGNWGFGTLLFEGITTGQLDSQALEWLKTQAIAQPRSLG